MLSPFLLGWFWPRRPVEFTVGFFQNFFYSGIAQPGQIGLREQLACGFAELIFLVVRVGRATVRPAHLGDATAALRLGVTRRFQFVVGFLDCAGRAMTGCLLQQFT